MSALNFAPLPNVLSDAVMAFLFSFSRWRPATAAVQAEGDCSVERDVPAPPPFPAQAQVRQVSFPSVSLKSFVHNLR